jgi:hypothetical protein
MSVDRFGRAWILLQSENLYVLDLNNPVACLDPGWDGAPANFTDLFGMGFAADGPFNQCDKLYTHSFSGGSFSEGNNVGDLGWIDTGNPTTPGTLDLTVIGEIDYDGGELTGTGDGRLFAFAGAPAKLIEYDKATAAVLDTRNLGLNLGNAFAFAFYAGDFFFFTSSGGNSTVSRHDYIANSTATFTTSGNVPIRIVGAGVSTCVPYQPQ